FAAVTDVVHSVHTDVHSSSPRVSDACGDHALSTHRPPQQHRSSLLLAHTERDHGDDDDSNGRDNDRWSIHVRSSSRNSVDRTSHATLDPHAPKSDYPGFAAVAGCTPLKPPSTCTGTRKPLPDHRIHHTQYAAQGRTENLLPFRPQPRPACGRIHATCDTPDTFAARPTRCPNV